MEGQQLICRREFYLGDENSTKLNTVDLWTIDSAPIYNYIHGGAWRDPEVDSKSFEPAVNILWKSSLKDSIAAFASINYRLSPYPSHPKLPSSPDDPSRNVHHPFHVNDVAEALLYLDKNYNIDNRYLLVGHSAGATMAFELSNTCIPSRSLPQPICILGVSGIYNFEAFVESHGQIPAYKELMDSAFSDSSIWKQASPSESRSSEGKLWEHAKAVIISHSKEDRLVENAQATFMLERARTIPQSKERVHFLEATGPHDGIWESGHILAGLITKAVEILNSVGAEFNS